jgi:hypothetical protein
MQLLFISAPPERFVPGALNKSILLRPRASERDYGTATHPLFRWCFLLMVTYPQPQPPHAFHDSPGSLSRLPFPFARIDRDLPFARREDIGLSQHYFAPTIANKWQGFTSQSPRISATIYSLTVKPVISPSVPRPATRISVVGP